MCIKEKVFIVTFFVKDEEMETYIKASCINTAVNKVKEKLDKVFENKVKYVIKGCYDRDVCTNFVEFGI